MAGPVISLSSSCQGGNSFATRLKEVENFCRWIDCAATVKGWKPWFLGAFDHDLVTFAESREKAFAKFVLGNGRCYENATMWSEMLNREIMPSDVVEVPVDTAKEWLMNEESDPTGKPLILAAANGSWPSETLSPVVLTVADRGWYFWLIEGAVLHGWQIAFLPVETARDLVSKGILYFEPEDSADMGVMQVYSDFAELPSVVSEDGFELCFALISLESGDVKYVNPNDDPEGGE